MTNHLRIQSNHEKERKTIIRLQKQISAAEIVEIGFSASEEISRDDTKKMGLFQCTMRQLLK